MTQRINGLGPKLGWVMAVVLSFCLIPQPASTQSPLPWMNTALSPAQRTELLIQAMTLDEKIQQIGNQAFRDTELPGCGFTAIGRQIQGIPRA